MQPTLQLADPAYPTVFAIGDVADMQNQKMAWHAVQHVHVVAENIVCLFVAENSNDAMLSKYSQVLWRNCTSLGMVSCCLYE